MVGVRSKSFVWFEWLQAHVGGKAKSWQLGTYLSCFVTRKPLKKEKERESTTTPLLPNSSVHQHNFPSLMAFLGMQRSVSFVLLQPSSVNVNQATKQRMVIVAPKFILAKYLSLSHHSLTPFTPLITIALDLLEFLFHFPSIFTPFYYFIPHPIFFYRSQFILFMALTHQSIAFNNLPFYFYCSMILFIFYRQECCCPILLKLNTVVFFLNWAAEFNRVIFFYGG